MIVAYASITLLRQPKWTMTKKNEILKTNRKVPIMVLKWCGGGIERFSVLET